MDNLWIIYGYGWWLNPTPLKKYESIGMMKIPTEWEKKCSKPPTRNPSINLIESDEAGITRTNTPKTS